MKNVRDRRKWWNRGVRSVNLFVYRYWWLCWLLFIAAVLLWWFFCDCNVGVGDSNKNRERTDRLIRKIEECDPCKNYVIDSIPEQENEDEIHQIVDCNEETRSGGFGIQSNKHLLGDQGGVVKIDYDMDNMPDKLEVFYEGQLVASTHDVHGNINGFVGENIMSCCGTLKFEYSPVNDNHCIVVVTGPENGTVWSYRLSCPE